MSNKKGRFADLPREAAKTAEGAKTAVEVAAASAAVFQKPPTVANQIRLLTGSNTDKQRGAVKLLAMMEPQVVTICRDIGATEQLAEVYWDMLIDVFQNYAIEHGVKNDQGKNVTAGIAITGWNTDILAAKGTVYASTDATRSKDPAVKGPAVEAARNNTTDRFLDACEEAHVLCCGPGRFSRIAWPHGHRAPSTGPKTSKPKDRQALRLLLAE